MNSSDVVYYLQILGLDICKDTIVGDEMRRGISGGQKKRVTIGFCFLFFRSVGCHSPPSFHLDSIHLQGRYLLGQQRRYSWTRYQPAWTAPAHCKYLNAYNRLPILLTPPCSYPSSNPLRRPSISSMILFSCLKATLSIMVLENLSWASSRPAVSSVQKGKELQISYKR